MNGRPRLSRCGPSCCVRSGASTTVCRTDSYREAAAASSGTSSPGRVRASTSHELGRAPLLPEDPPRTVCYRRQTCTKSSSSSTSAIHPWSSPRHTGTSRCPHDHRPGHRGRRPLDGDRIGRAVSSTVDDQARSLATLTPRPPSDDPASATDRPRAGLLAGSWGSARTHPSQARNALSFFDALGHPSTVR